MSLALATVLYEWRRYLAAVVALGFSGLLLLAQIGMFMGIGKSITAIVDRSRADIFVLPASADSLLNAGGLPRRDIPLLYMDRSVIKVADMSGGGGQFSNLGAGGHKSQDNVEISSVDTDPGALTLPVDFSDDVRGALSIPYAVAVDESELGRLGVKRGDKAAVDGHAVTVAAVLTHYPNLGNGPKIYVSRQTLMLLGKAQSSSHVGILLVKIDRPAEAEAVRDRLNRLGGGQFRAWTRSELSAANERAFMRQQIIGIFLGFSVLLGAGIGVGITSQTLRGAVLGNIKEFASLRALGVSISSLRVVVMELSFWVGVAGLAAAALLLGLVYELAGLAGVPMFFPPVYVGLIVLFLLLISIASGALATSVLSKSQPADLLR